MTFTGYTGNALTIFVPREVGFQIIGAWTPGVHLRAGRRRPHAAARRYPVVSIGAGFDGWGYMHLYDNAGDDLAAVDHFAIEEARGRALRARVRRPDRARVRHRPDREPRLQLLLRGRPAGDVASATDGLDEVGKFIDKGGNNFWGVEAFDGPEGGRLIAPSDRDFGLYLFRYTGEGGAGAVAAGLRRRQRGDRARHAVDDPADVHRRQRQRR